MREKVERCGEVHLLSSHSWSLEIGNGAATITGIAFSPSGKVLALVDANGVVTLLTLRDPLIARSAN